MSSSSSPNKLEAALEAGLAAGLSAALAMGAAVLGAELPNRSSAANGSPENKLLAAAVCGIEMRVGVGAAPEGLACVGVLLDRGVEVADEVAAVGTGRAAGTGEALGTGAGLPAGFAALLPPKRSSSENKGFAAFAGSAAGLTAAGAGEAATVGAGLGLGLLLEANMSSSSPKSDAAFLLSGFLVASGSKSSSWKSFLPAVEAGAA